MKHRAKLLPLVVFLALPRPVQSQQPKAETKSAPAVEARRLDVPGALLRYTAEGRGPVVVTFTGSENIGHALYSGRLRQELTIVNADPSWIPADRIATLTMADVVEDIERVRLALGVDRISVMGHSMFAPVPLEYALRFPGHAGWSILTGGLPYTTSKAFQTAKAYWDTAASPERKAIYTANLAALKERGMVGRSVTEQFWDGYAAAVPMRFADARFDLGGFVKAVAVKPGLENGFIDRFWRVVLKDFDHTAQYRRIRTPVLVIAGKYDFGAPWFLWNGVGAGMADYTFHLFENAGHNPMLETPAEFDGYLLTWMLSRPPRSDVRTTTSADGVKIRYAVAGLKQPGVPIVFVHGFTGNRSFWEPHISVFARTHPVVAVDLAGFGESGTNRRPWSMKAHGQDVLAVLKDLDLRDAVLVGHSMGGAAVLEAAVQDPARIRGVVVVDIFQNPDQRYASDHGAKFFLKRVQSSWHKPSRPAAPPMEPMPDSLLARFDARPPEAPPEYWRPIVEDFFRWASNDLVPRLKALRVPVAAINADYAPTDVVAYRRYAPAFQLRLMPRVDHLGAIWQETALFDRHLEELAQAMAPGLSKAAPAPALPATDAWPTGVRGFIEQANARLEGWYRTGQIDSVASYFAEEAQQIASGAPPLVGREAIRAFWTQATRAGEWNIALATQEVSASGEMAVERGVYAVAYTPGPNAPKELSAPTLDHGRYVVLWRKNADGGWRISWDAAVSDAALPAPAPTTSVVKARPAAGALASVEGVFEYLAPLKGVAIAQGGRFSFVHGPADGGRGVDGYGGTYELSGDTAAATLLYSSDSAFRPGMHVRWIHRQIAGDTLRYEYVDSAGRTTVGGTIRRIAPGPEPKVATRSPPAVAPEARAAGGPGAKPPDVAQTPLVGGIPASGQAPTFGPDLLPMLRRASELIPGERATAVRVVSLIPGRGPRKAAVEGAPAGDTVVMGYPVYQVRFRRGWIMVDGGVDSLFVRPGLTFFRHDYDAIQQGLRAARLVLLTHEHPDHVAGLFRSLALPEVQQHTLLTRAQVRSLVEHPLDPVLGLDSAMAAKYLVVDYQGWLPIAPGVVLLQAPGHSPGTQLVYVRLASGKEILISGDVAWHTSGITEGRQKPERTSKAIGEDREMIARELKWLKEVSDAGVAVVVYHDQAAHDSLVARGILTKGFDLRP